MNCNATVTPSATPLPVIWSTSHACAIDCIHVPVVEISCPAKYKR